MTYDDGPGARLTPQLLDLLKKRGARATFFWLGRNADGQKDIAARLLDDGHELGSHTYDHTHAWKAPPWRAASDYRAGAALIGDLGGDAQFFRPPYGKLTLAGWISGRLAGARFGWWTVDSQDSWSPRDIEALLGEIEAGNGGVVLMHDWDSYGDAHDGETHEDRVLRMTARILDLAEEKGLEVRPLGEIMRAA